MKYDEGIMTDLPIAVRPEFNRREAERYLAKLCNGASLDATKFVFQVFDDSPAKRKELAGIMHATLYAALPWLKAKQAEGRGVFVTIAETKDGGRKDEDFIRSRGVWQDHDDPNVPPATLPLEPHIVVESSAGKWHQYLLTQTTDREALKAAQNVLVERYGSDKNCKGLTRVLRLPGSLNLKDQAHPWLVRIESLSDREPYTWADVEAALPSSPRNATTPAKTSAPSTEPKSDDAELVRLILTGEDYHGAILTLSARYVHAGMSQAQVVEVIQGFIDSSGDTSDRAKSRRTEVPRTVAGAFKKGFAPTTAGSITDYIDQHLDAPGEVLVADVAEQIAHSQLSPVEVASFVTRLKAHTKIGKGVIERQIAEARRGDEGAATHRGYALRLLDEMKAEAGGVEPVAADGQLFTVGKDGIWRGRDFAGLEVEAGKRFDGQESCTRRTDYMAIAAHALAIAGAEQPGFFDYAPIGLASSVGFHRLDGGEVVLEPLTPAHRQRYMAPHAPVDAPAPTFDAFLAETFDSKHEGDSEAQRGLLQEIFGAVVLGLMARYEKAVLAKGEGRSGKGTLLKVLEALVPPESRTASSPFRWSGEYYLAGLAGMRLNVVGELPEDTPIPAADFKTVIGRDSLTGRHPTHRPFTFRNSAAHIFNSNHFVGTKDRSEAFFTRWIILDFPNSRIGMPGTAIDVDLASRIIDREIGAIAHWALVGAQRLMNRGRFEMTAAHDRLMGKWRRRSDSLMEFLHDDEVVSLDYGLVDFAVPRTAFYEAYAAWCIDSGRRAMTKQRVFESLDEPAAAALGVRPALAPVTRARIVEGVKFCKSLDDL